MTESWDDLLARLPLSGLTVSGVSVGEHSALTLTFGTEDDACRMTILEAVWRVEDPQAVLAASGDETDDLAARVATLNGRGLASVEVDPKSLSARLAFAGGVNLVTFSVHSHDVEHWSVAGPDGAVLTAGPGAAWSISPTGGS